MTEPKAPARATRLVLVPEHVPVKAAPAPLGMLIGGTPSPPYTPWAMAAKGPPPSFHPPDGRHAPIRMYDDAHVPTQRDIEIHLQRHGQPAPPPVRAPPRPVGAGGGPPLRKLALLPW